MRLDNNLHRVGDQLSARQRELFQELGDSLGKEIVAQQEKGFLDRFRDALGL